MGVTDVTDVTALGNGCTDGETDVTDVTASPLSAEPCVPIQRCLNTPDACPSTAVSHVADACLRTAASHAADACPEMGLSWVVPD